ncbi:Serine/threonine-protein kinase BLUS1 [Forsythia ovata]|uniref:Serine/threonine-protein kinase BLUS1 n=1 Tax=Forsythia ovata TaxID=205694 RepID=A0ABD1VGX4_9LAMI
MAHLHLTGKTLIPVDGLRDKYTIMKKIGIASAANVYKAMYLPENLPPEYVSVKVIPFLFARECTKFDQEIQMSVFSSTPNAENVVEIMKTFYSNNKFSCASMAYMSEGSLRFIMSKWFTSGLPEDCIAIALRETLKGLSFLHGRRRVHGKIDAGQIFVNGNSNGVAIKLGFEGSMYEHYQERWNPLAMASTSTLPLRDITNWGSAPEVIFGAEKGNKYVHKPHSDIWLVGITALELAYGCFPVRDRAEFEAVIEKIIKKKKLPTMEKLKRIADMENVKGKGKMVLNFLEKKFKSLAAKGERKERQFSPEFEKVVVKCLSGKPEKRPTVDQLLQFEFFRRSKDLKFFQRAVVNGKRVIDKTDH